MQKNSLVFIGEAMLELINKSPQTMAKSYAGDVFNTAVYLKRAFPDLSASFLSAIGKDAISEEFKQVVQDEGVNTHLLGVSETRQMGIYMVINDSEGERSFVYWRDQSAAKKTIGSLNDFQKQSALDCDYVFFSGITLAILERSERNLFWSLIEKMKNNGAKIIFDPNYRERLWTSKIDAIGQMEKAFELSDWLMPGLEDFEGLYGFCNVEECLEFCEKYNFKELILKQGAQSVHVVTPKKHYVIPIKPSNNIVDTTSAGDAFNGLYLGGRTLGWSVEQAVRVANKGACEVIATRGAIMPKKRFQKFWATL